MQIKLVLFHTNCSFSDLCNIWSPPSWKAVDAQSQRLVCSWNASGLTGFGSLLIARD